MAHTIILGSNFAGVTAALELRRKVGKEHKITVVSPTEDFLYVPSLIWVPFGRRKVKDITFNIRKVLEKKKVGFIKDAAVRVDAENSQVHTEKHGILDYDYVISTTGVKLKFDILENLHPEAGMIENIVIPKYAEKAYDKFKELVKDPGPVVVGATQGASCMGAAYEYLFNLEKTLRKHKVRDKVEITWLTPEPYLGHFGMDGMTGAETMLSSFMKMFNINFVTDASIEKIEKDKITLKNGKVLPYKMAMLMPPFTGADAMLNSPELIDDKGFVETNDGYQHIKYKNVFAAGLAVQVKAPFKCESTPFGVPKTGYPSDVTGKIAAQNIANMINGKDKFVEKGFGDIPAMCVMDAGNKEVYIFANKFFRPRQFAIMVPNVLNDVGKVFLEKYMIYKNKKGLSFLP
ncbi:NAD(P)/FAD-dependent oxidoreductase [Algivirga pacifica]|uniref:FAD/NAD(P)-binding oxidoreductase n=1 Tax=Algivirga pacifica TaxID=1162670 RepID=A0ABP9D920_9BACT